VKFFGFKGLWSRFLGLGFGVMVLGVVSSVYCLGFKGVGFWI